MSTLKCDIRSRALDTEVLTAIVDKLNHLHKLVLTHCGNSACKHSKGKVIAMYDDTAVLLECPLITCQNNWLVCLHPKCDGKRQKRPFKELQQYKKHKDNTHKKRKKKPRLSGGQSLPFSDEATGLGNQEGHEYEDNNNTMVDFVDHQDVVDSEDNHKNHGGLC